MNAKNKLKNVIPLLLFNILLPTADVVTDLHLIIKLYREGVKYKLVCKDPEDRMINKLFCEYEYDYEDFVSFYEYEYGWLNGAATALLIPFILNYIFTMACWMRSEEKIKTLIFPLLNIYPQFCEYT